MENIGESIGRTSFHYNSRNIHKEVSSKYVDIRLFTHNEGMVCKENVYHYIKRIGRHGPKKRRIII